MLSSVCVDFTAEVAEESSGHFTTSFVCRPLRSSASSAVNFQLCPARDPCPRAAGRRVHAEEDADGALRIDPDNLPGLKARAEARFGQRNFPGAEADFSRFLDLAPGALAVRVRRAATRRTGRAFWFAARRQTPAAGSGTEIGLFKSRSFFGPRQRALASSVREHVQCDSTFVR